MHGVTTALVAFLFVCVVFPNLVKNRPQYYAALAAVCAIILLDAVGMALSPLEIARFRVFAYVACAFLQVAAVVLLFLAAGGITWRQLADDMKDAYKVIRRGGEEEEIIIPLSQKLSQPQAQRRAEPEAPSQRIVIDEPTTPPAAEHKPAEGADPDESQR